MNHNFIFMRIQGTLNDNGLDITEVMNPPCLLYYWKFDSLTSDTPNIKVLNEPIAFYVSGAWGTAPSPSLIGLVVCLTWTMVCTIQHTFKPSPQELLHNWSIKEKSLVILPLQLSTNIMSSSRHTIILHYVQYNNSHCAEIIFQFLAAF
jgi:hypothetical protein